MDEGLSLDSIMKMFRDMLPTIAYFVNMINRLLDLFSAYLEIDLTPDLDNGTGNDTTV